MSSSLICQIQKLEHDAKILELIVKMAFTNGELNEAGKKIVSVLSKTETKIFMDIYKRLNKE